MIFCYCEVKNIFKIKLNNKREMHVQYLFRSVNLYKQSVVSAMMCTNITSPVL